MTGACVRQGVEQAPTAAAPVIAYPHLGIPTENGQTELASVEIKLERTKCYGWCPVYSLTLRGDGTGMYRGQKFVIRTGDVPFAVSNEDFRWLLRLFDDLDFFSIDHKPHNISDVDSEILTLKVGARTKSFENRWGRSDSDATDTQFHRGLSDLALAVDNAANVEQWIGGQGERAERFAGSWRKPRR